MKSSVLILLFLFPVLGACSSIRTAYYAEPESRFRRSSELSETPVARIKTAGLTLEIRTPYSGRFITSAGPAFCIPVFPAGEIAIYQLNRQTPWFQVRILPDSSRAPGSPIQLAADAFSLETADGKKYAPSYFAVHRVNKRGLSGPVIRAKPGEKFVAVSEPVILEMGFSRVRYSAHESFVLRPGVRSPAMLLPPVRFTVQRDRQYRILVLPFAYPAGPR